MNDSSSLNFSGLNLISFRMRYNIYEGKGAVPTVGFQVNIDIPRLGADYPQRYVAPRMDSYYRPEVFLKTGG